MIRSFTDSRNDQLKNFYEDQDMTLERQNNITKALTRGQLSNEYEKSLFKWMVRAHKVLNGKTVDMSEFRDIMEFMEVMRRDNERDYYKALVRPEQTKGAKIPSPIPIPSASFQLKQSIWLTPNALGNMVIVFNPWGLFSTDRSTLWLNNSSTLTGTGANLGWRCTKFGQQLPGSIYNKYRVVSSAVTLRYVGRLDIVQGVCGGSIVFENIPNGDPSVVTDVLAANPLAKYGDFNLAMDAYYTQENLTLHGTRSIYFPLDNTYEQYVDLGVTKEGFANLLYISGGVSAANSYKLDICVNVECLPDSTFLNYMPVSATNYSSNAYDPQKIQNIVKEAQKQPVTRAEDMDFPSVPAYSGGILDTIDGVIGTIGKIVPSITSIASLFI